jgi:hypothetical protein
MSPLKARKLIRDGAFNALQKLKRQPESFSCTKLKPPYVLEMKLRADGDKPARTIRAEHPDSIVGLLNLE